MIIEQYPRGDLVHAYFDDSSEETITNGGSEVFLTTPSGRTYECRPSASAIAPDFTCEFHKSLPASEQAKENVIFCDSKAAFQATSERRIFLPTGFVQSWSKYMN